MKKIAFFILTVGLIIFAGQTLNIGGKLENTAAINIIRGSSLPEAVSDNTKFNLEVDLPQSYRTISPGDELWFTTKLMNLANDRRVDVTLTYQILDASRELKYSKSETVAVETQASFVGNIQTPDSLSAGLHYLKVSLQSPYGTTESEATFEVTKKQAKQQFVIKFSLFDIIVNIPEDYKEVSPGDELLTSIKLINVGSEGRIDVFLDYWITDESGNMILSQKETVAVETQNNFVRTFNIPKDAKAGDYTFHAKLSYPDLRLEPEYATSFKVKQSRKTFYIYSAFGAVILIAVGLLLFKNRKKIRKQAEESRIRNRIKKITKKGH